MDDLDRHAVDVADAARRRPSGAGTGAARARGVLARASLPPFVADATARVFGWAAHLRDDRVFHPRGHAFAGVAHIHDAAQGLIAEHSEVEVIVRVSRGLGLPEPLPDFNGVAIRLLAAHGPGEDQDLLFVSGPSAPVARHLLLPVATFGGSGYTSILPYRTPNGLLMLGCKPLPQPTIVGLAAAVPFEIEVMAAGVFDPWWPAATLRIDQVLDAAESEELEFDPYRTGPSLVPVGVLNRLRVPAYAGSQAARRG